MWIQTPDRELSRRFDRAQRRYVPLVPYDCWLFSFSVLGTRRSAWIILSKPENAITAASCISFNYWENVFLWCWVLGHTLVWFTTTSYASSNYLEYWIFYCWVLGHALVRVDGVTTSWSISCENDTSKQWGELRIKLPKYCYVMINLRKSNIWGTLDFRCSPSRFTARYVMYEYPKEYSCIKISGCIFCSLYESTCTWYCKMIQPFF